MILKAPKNQVIEHYEQYLTLKNQSIYQLCWQTKVLSFYTCGGHNRLVECLEFLPHSLQIRKILPQGGLGFSISLEEFNACHADEPLYFHSNCHGFTFAHGKYLINNYFVNIILEDEYEEVIDKNQINIGNFDVFCLKDADSDEWIHSCKYQYDLFIHKEGFRKFAVHLHKNEILNISDYSHTIPHYFKRKQGMCRGICLNAVGEKFQQVFGNEHFNF